jgi:hypothetical protein
MSSRSDAAVRRAAALHGAAAGPTLAPQAAPA